MTIKTKLKETLARLQVPAAGVRRTMLRLPRGWPETDTSVYWYAPDRNAGEQAGRADNLSELPAFVRSAAVHVWTPAAETLLTRVNLPTRSRARILQALPYALEDQLLDEPDKLHFSYVREPDNTLAVAVTRRARLSLWLDVLHGAGLRPASLCPATLALPISSDTWSATFDRDELWVRNGAFSGFVALADFAAPPPLLATALREAMAENRSPQRLTLYRPPGAVDLDAWRDALDLPVAADGTDFWEIASIPALNLMQAEFSQTGHLHQMARPLRPAAIMLAVWLVGMLTVDTIEWLRLRHTYQNTVGEMRDIFMRSFPDAKTVLDPAVQMQKNLEALQTRGGGPADMLPLLARVTPALKAQQPRVKLNGIKYGERSLTVDLALPDYQTLDAMKNNLQSANLDVEVLAANSRAGEVEGRLRIQPAGAKAKPRQAS